jgi:hypothetical protein
MNHILQGFARQWLKDGLAKLPEGSHLLFRRMYSHDDLTRPIDAVVDEMAPEKLNWAMQQVENSLEKAAHPSLRPLRDDSKI